jgi:aminoglycoside phosphotransferase (APT) family kinase protein
MTTRGALIGRGRTAEIYEWGEAQVVKLFLPGIPESWPRKEARVAAIVSGICRYAPASEGTVEIEEDGRKRVGIIYERVSGPTLTRTILPRVWQLPHLAQEFGRVHAALHELSGPALAELPRQHEHLRYDVANAPVSDAVKTAATTALAALPDGDRLCHRDYHPDQFVFSPRGPVILDWMTAGIGNPHGDVARTSLILTAYSLPPDMAALQGALINAVRSLFHRLYLRYYQQARPLDLTEMRAWLPVLAVGRLRENVPGEEAYLRAMIARAFGTAE